MKANEVITRLEELITDGSLQTKIYKLEGVWTSILVNVEDYSTNKNLVIVIENKTPEYINGQISKLAAALHPETSNKQ